MNPIKWLALTGNAINLVVALLKWRNTP